MGADTTEAGVPARDGIYGWIPEDQYHADRGSLSVSGAKLLLPPSCPAKFKERMDNPPPPKTEYTFGHAAHALVLGKGADIIEVDAPDWRTKAAREARDQARNGIAPMLTKELDIARAMAATVKAHPVAGPLFERGHAEKSLYRTDPETGIRLRGRTDWLTLINRDGRERLTIVDYKTSTTANPVALERLFVKFGYHMQAPWYLDLVKGVGMSDDPQFLFVVQEKTPPYLVTVIEYDDLALAEGRRRNREAITTYLHCRETGQWPGYHDNDDAVTISLPLWAFDTDMEMT